MTKIKYFILTHIPIIGEFIKTKIDGVGLPSQFYQDYSQSEIRKFEELLKEFQTNNPNIHIDKNVRAELLSKATESP